MKDENFQLVMDIAGKRFNIWNERLLSYVAKEVHIKSVVQALLTFTMGVFLLSKGFCEKYEKMIHDFLVGR